MVKARNQFLLLLTLLATLLLTTSCIGVGYLEQRVNTQSIVATGLENSDSYAFHSIGDSYEIVTRFLLSEYQLCECEYLPESELSKFTGHVEGGMFGLFATGLSIEEANNHTSFPIAQPSFLPENTVFHGAALYGNMCTFEAESVALIFHVQSSEELSYIRLSQTRWEDSIYASPTGEKRLCPEGISVFAGHYSGGGRDSIDVVSIQLYDTESFFATPDRRSFSEISVLTNEYGSSLYWLRDELVFTLTISPSVPSGVIDFEMMRNIAGSVG